MFICFSVAFLVDEPVAIVALYDDDGMIYHH